MWRNCDKGKHTKLKKIFLNFSHFCLTATILYGTIRSRNTRYCGATNINNTKYSNKKEKEK